MGKDIINEFYAFGHVPAGPLYVEYIFIGVGLTVTAVWLFRDAIKRRKQR